MEYANKISKYTRPNITYTDTLTKREILDFLQDFEKVDNINIVPIGTYVSYIDTSNDQIVFRIGGTILINKQDYLVLSGGKTNFSVQKNNKIFFRRLNYSEMKKELDNHILEYKNSIAQKNKQIKDLILYIKKLKSKINESNVYI